MLPNPDIPHMGEDGCAGGDFFFWMKEVGRGELLREMGLGKN